MCTFGVRVMCRGCVCILIIRVVYLDYLNISMGYYSYLEGINNTGHTFYE